MKNIKFFLPLLALCFGVFFTQCKKDDSFLSEKDAFLLDSLSMGIINDSNAVAFNRRAQDLSQLQLHPLIAAPTLVEGPDLESTDCCDCEVATYQFAPSVDNMIYSDHSRDVMYVGAPFLTESTVDGSNAPLTNVERAPIVISTSLITNEGEKPFVTVEDPSLSSVREAINELLYRLAPNATPAKVFKEIEVVNAKEEVDLSFDASLGGLGAKISASYDFQDSLASSRFLITFYQEYYDITMDVPDHPSAFFTTMPDAETIDSWNGISPVYLSSITYGRVVYFMVESSMNEEMVHKALEASFNRFIASGSINLESEDVNTLSSSKISALVLGGSSDGAVKGINSLESMEEFLAEDAQFSVNTPGVPIAYKFNYLSDNSTFNVIKFDEYPVRKCNLRGDPYTFHPRNGEAFEFCPILTMGDAEFDGNGPRVNGYIKILVKNANEIWAEIEATFTELVEDGINKSVSKINEQFHLHTLNSSDIIFSSFTDDVDVYFDFSDTNHNLDSIPFSGADFIELIEGKWGYEWG